MVAEEDRDVLAAEGSSPPSSAVSDLAEDTYKHGPFVVYSVHGPRPVHTVLQAGRLSNGLQNARCVGRGFGNPEVVSSDRRRPSASSLCWRWLGNLSIGATCIVHEPLGIHLLDRIEGCDPGDPVGLCRECVPVVEKDVVNRYRQLVESGAVLVPGERHLDDEASAIIAEGDECFDINVALRVDVCSSPRITEAPEEVVLPTGDHSVVNFRCEEYPNVKTLFAREGNQAVIFFSGLDLSCEFIGGDFYSIEVICADDWNINIEDDEVVITSIVEFAIASVRASEGNAQRSGR